jgi:hypothetical protein
VTGSTWTILVPTVAARAELFERLLGILLPQLDVYGGRARVLAYQNHGDPVLGAIRDRLVAAAGTEYVSFVDDDDTVPSYFVEEVMRAIDSAHPDHVGFWLDYYHDGTFRERVRHSISGPRRWARVHGVLHRDLTHVDPIRTELALRGSFIPMRPGRPEDRIWVRQVRNYVKSEVFVDRSMYHYLYRPAESVSLTRELLPAGERKPVEHPFFAWHPDSD